MGTSNPRKRIWIEAARHYIADWLTIYGLNICQKATVELLDFFAAKARTRKDARDRNNVWYEVFRDYIVAQMLRLNIIERQVARGITHYMLEPNLKMGKEKAGLAKFEKLVDLVGVVEAYKLVNVTVLYIPAYEVKTEVRDPRFENGERHTKMVPVKECTETEFTFVGEGSTRELVFWTIVLGNQPTFQVGPAPKRVKEGKERRKR